MIKTQKQIRKEREKNVNRPRLTVWNITNHPVNIQTKAPGGDFYTSEATIRIPAKKSYTDYVDRFNQDQLRNLRARKEIK